MLKKHLEAEMLKKLGYQPTLSQENLIRNLSDFILDERSDNIFLIRGFAGTGKTTIIKAFVQTVQQFNSKCVLMAPTGRAAKVMSAYTGHPSYTIHRKIFRQKSSTDGFGNFGLNFNSYSDTYFIVDEASMISNSSMEASLFGSGRLLEDLFKFVYNDKRCKLILIGDEAQLPPVGLEISPALDKNNLEGYNYNVYNSYLKEIVRQDQDSGIVMNSFSIRELISGGLSKYPKLNTKEFNDVKRVNGEMLIEEISNSYDKTGYEETIIVCRSNKRANKYNEGIRRTILWKEDELSTGDFLMVVKNNYYWNTDDKKLDFIANGEIVEVIRIFNYEEVHGLRFANIRVRHKDNEELEFDTKVILDTLTIEGPSLSSESVKTLFYSVLLDYQDTKGKQAQYKKVKNDPYYNALQVKFAYAVTCHKSQGGQWKHVYVDQGYLTKEMVNTDFLRWLYTAITRATEKLFLINFNKEFFSENEDFDY